MTSENNNRIAKNTIMLYFRLLLTISVSLYTSRIVLDALGVIDYGIYNVVGGVVLMLSFLNTAMSSATQRFLSFELGKNDINKLRDVFSASINIHIFIAIAIVVLAETIGLWFLNSELNIPIERMKAANWVYQFSILSFAISIISVPYNAMIIAHEKMHIYAYLSILESILKLLIVFILVLGGMDKLILYAVLVFFVTAIIRAIYKIYCTFNFPESKYHLIRDKQLHFTLMSYASWNLFGNVAAVTFNQGINILLNIFFDPAINAARAITYQVNGAVNGFVSNFQIAINPQIVKSYAVNNIEYMHELIFQGSKYSFFLLLILSLPILLDTETILALWLVEVPDYTIIFCQLVLINTLIDCISGTLMTAAQATGRIKLYQSIVGGLLLLILPLSYILLKNDFPPQSTLYVSISISLIALVARLKIVSPLIGLSIVDYIKNVILRILIVTIASIIFPLAIKYYIDINDIYNLLIISSSCLLSTTCSIYYLGLKEKERYWLKIKVSNYTLKVKRIYRP